jgi:hypothetical protein
MSREDTAARVPDLVLERYRLGELPAAEAEWLERRLREDEGLRQRLDALDLSDSEIQRRQPPGWLAERVRARLDGRGTGPGPRRAEAPRPVWARHWPVPAALAVAATVLLVLAPRTIAPPPVTPVPTAAPEPGDRIKGMRPALVLFRHSPSGGEALVDGAVARPGDLVRVGYRAAGRAYGVVLSIDGRGAVTLHLPSGGARAAALRSGAAVLLDHSYELDDAPRAERFFFVTSGSPFDVAPVVDAARAAAKRSGAPPRALALPASLEQSTFSLLKGAER